MDRAQGIFIAVEQYQDPKIGKVKYAEKDAEGIARALRLHGLTTARSVVLLSLTATKTRIESAIRKVCGSLSPDDLLILSYAGHGFSDGMQNYITCHDTVHSDLIATSISLQMLLREIGKAKCRRAVFLLDSCHSGLEIDDSMRGLISDMTDEDFKEFCADSEHHLAFASCRTDQQSYSADALSHGIWSYHIIEAFEGRNKNALERGKFLTASSLQNFLSDEVPRTMRKTKIDVGSQTPISWGNLSRETILADFTSIFAKKEEEDRAGLGELKRVSFLGSTWGAIKKLSGFRKHHRVPNSVNDATRGFVQGVGEEELAEKAKSIADDLKEYFAYKRRDIELDQDVGSATITTKDFTVDITIDIDTEDPSQYVLRTEVYDIANPGAITTASFGAVFDGVFDSIVFEVSGRIGVKELIDKIESVDENKSISLEYPPSANECTIRVIGYPAKICFSPHDFSLQFGRDVPVEDLIKAFKKLPSIISAAGITPLLPAK